MDIPDFFKSNGSLINGTKNICEGFNDFFVEIGPKLAQKIQKSQTDYSNFLGTAKNYNLKFNKVTNKMISEVAKQMKPKTSFGHDGISSKLLKDIQNRFCPT